MIYLVSDINTKRSIYFEKAANELNREIIIMNHKEIMKNLNNEGFIKIDPPTNIKSELSSLQEYITNYFNFLQTISLKKQFKFLNTPQSIMDTLDKIKCKKILLENNIKTTKFFQKRPNDINELRDLALSNKCFRLFIKPRYGAGAAGIIAYKISPFTKQEIIYTLMYEVKGQIVNTKKIRKIKDVNIIEKFINFTLNRNHILEEWILKGRYKEYCYDLRVVYQFGKIDWIVARGSKYPMTNLHLNNKTIPLEELQIPDIVIEKIENICHKAVSCFEGLNVVGFDFILKGSSLEPIIIEMNGQGDLIYQDIFEENKIYKNQIKKMLIN